MSDHYENEKEDFVAEEKRYRDYSKPQKQYIPEETIKDVKYLEAFDWDERGLTKETLEKFGVKCKPNAQFGPSKLDKVYFPYLNKDGKITGYKVKDLTKEKAEKGHFYTIGHVGTDSQLFGQNVARKSAKMLFICEGEVDALSAYQALLEHTKEEYKAYTPAVVSIGCGTVHAVDHLAHNPKFLERYKEFRLAFDNDELTDIEKLKKNPGMKGKEATQAVGGFLIEQSNRVFITKWYDWVNDCSDLLQKGMSEQLHKQLLFDIEAFSAEKVLSAGDIQVDDLLKPKEKGAYVDSFPILMEKLWGIRKSELTILTAMSGVGKCFQPGTKIRMADGSLKSIEEITKGEKVMGVDGSPREVLETTSGLDKMYKVSQVKGENYIVNSQHLLSLKATEYLPRLNLKKGEIIHISVLEYLSLPKSYKKRLKGFVADKMEFEPSSPCFEPWAIGNWLADGSLNTPMVTVNVEDREIVSEWLRIGKVYNYYTKLKNYGNRDSKARTIPLSGGFIHKLREIGVLNNKHIPNTYKFGSVEERVELLSGILDGDGHLHNNGYEIVFKTKQLCNDVAFVARSLGLRVSYAEKFSSCPGFDGATYHKLFISGNTEILKLRLKRKQASPRKQVKNPLVHRISVEFSHFGDYYGICIDGDKLHLLSDFTVVHNTVASAEIAYKLAETTGEKVALVFLEETSQETFMRMIARRLKKNYYTFIFDPLSYCTREEFQEAYSWAKEKFFFLDVFGAMRIGDLMNTFKSLYYANGCGYIVFDHLSMIASGSTVDDERRLIDLMMTELASFMAQTDVGCLAVSHLSRQAQTEIGKLSDLKEDKWICVRKEHLRGSSSLEQLSWNVLGLDMLLKPNRERGDVRLTVLKNRTIGKLGVADQFKMDEKTGLIIPTQIQGYGG